MFGDLKYPGEDGFIPDVDSLLTDNFNEENLNAVV